MNKYLISFLVVFIITDACADVSTQIWGTQTVALVYNNDYIDLQEIQNISADKYKFDNSVVYINNLSDWQNWIADVEFLTNVSLRIKNLGMSNNGEKLEHVSSSDVVNVSVRDADNLYTVDFTAMGGDLFLNLARETDYTKIFRDSRGAFLENIRLNHPNDKMLLAMDKAATMQELNSVMNSSYHFNQKILMNPIKTLNRAVLIDSSSKIKTGIGADIDYIMSDKIDVYGGHIYVAERYEDLYFKIGVNLNRFSYSDDLNEFDGFVYGLDVCGRQYFDNFWLDGLIGANRTNFNADDVYVNNGNTNNPKGISEYMRLSAGYDYTQISDFVISPFVGLLFQNVKVLGISDKDTNLYAGLNGKYSVIMDGIKYEYGAVIGSDEKADFNIGANVGFLSVVDGAGAHIEINAFQNEFGINYKFSINAKVQF